MNKILTSSVALSLTTLSCLAMSDVKLIGKPATMVARSKRYCNSALPRSISFASSLGMSRTQVLATPMLLELLDEALNTVASPRSSYRPAFIHDGNPTPIALIVIYQIKDDPKTGAAIETRIFNRLKRVMLDLVQRKMEYNTNSLPSVINDTNTLRRYLCLLYYQNPHAVERFLHYSCPTSHPLLHSSSFYKRLSKIAQQFQDGALYDAKK